jgi:hypothetical protein
MLHYFRKIKYKVFGNFLGIKINVSYLTFIFFIFFLKKFKKIRNVIKRDKEIEMQIYQLKNEGFLKISSVLNAEEAKRVSNLATDLIQKSSDIKKAYDNNLSQNILKPCENLKIDINKILINEKVKNVLDNYFISDYRLKWIDFYRSQPKNDEMGSWLWHIDNYPVGIIKGMILFTDQDSRTGAMSFLSKKATYEIIKKKYYGLSSEKREKNLNSFIDKKAFNDGLTSFDGKAGDLYLFSGNQMHCANAPLNLYRDVSTFMIIPTLKKTNYKIDFEDIHTNYGFSRNPWAEI